jgi:hypothetical protein
MKPVIGPKNYLPVSGLGPLVEDKSIILEGNVLVVFNEVARPSNRSAWTDMAKAINKIKTSISESGSQINPKYEKQRTITTYSNFVMLSNDHCPFDLERGDRRIVVINNDPMKMDQSRFSMVADFAHNEKNGRLAPREYDDMIFEFHDFFSNWKVSNNLTTGDAPTNRAKLEMMNSLQPPIVQALQIYRDEGGAGATSPITCEEKLAYILKTVLGYKDFGRDKGRYDVWDQFVDHGVLKRVYRMSAHKKSRVETGLPGMRDREDYPLAARPQPTQTPQRVFEWFDSQTSFEMSSSAAVRDAVWQDVDQLMERGKGRGDVLSMIK